MISLSDMTENRRRTYNTMAKRKGTNLSSVNPTNMRVSSSVQEGYPVPT